MTLSKIGEKIFKMKYSRDGEESWEEACWRVAEYISGAELHFPIKEENPEKFRYEIAGIYYNLLTEGYFIPGGRILSNAGTSIKNLANCYVLSLEDSRKGIYTTLMNAAEIFANGGGVGFDFSPLREEGAEVKGTHSKASGPLSFMTLFDMSGEIVKQSSRRAAQMGVLSISHPDVEKFISFKAKPNDRNERLLTEYDENLKRYANGKLKNTKYFDVLSKTLLDEQLTHFNISLLVTDEFMRAVEEDKDWDLVGVVDGEVKKTVKARELFSSIAQQAWESGDPGLLFYDRINQDNAVKYIGDITSTNPCITGDTKIVTVYEGNVPIKDLVGRNVLIYTWNSETKLPEVSTMRNIRVTRKDSELVEVMFDSGLKVKCTPDHNFISFRGDKVPANKLKVGQSVRAFSMSKHRDGHIRVHGWVDGKAKHQYAARMIWEYHNGTIPEGMILHHKDFNETNNALDNFELVTPNEHNKIHYPLRRAKGFFKRRNHKVVAIRELDYTEDVYNGVVDNTHTYIIADDEPVAGITSGIVSNNCTIEGTLVSTKEGLRPVEQVKVGDLIQTTDGLNPVSSIESHENLDVYKVVLADGSDVVVTESHQFSAKRRKSDKLSFIPLKELKIGDYIEIAPLAMPDNDIEILGEDEEDFGFFVGCMIGDGCFTDGITSSNKLALSGSQLTKEWDNLLLSYIHKMGFSKVTQNKSKVEKPFTWFFGNKEEVDNFFEITKLKKSKAINKEIPEHIINSNPSVLRGLLNGLFSTDGNINISSKDHLVRFTSSSNKLVRDIRTILLMFGIQSRIYKAFRKAHSIGDREISNKNPRYELVIFGDSLERFRELIPLYKKEKQDKLNSATNTSSTNSWTARIKEIIPYGKANVYDLFEPTTDTWITDGIVNRGCGEVPLLPFEPCNLASINLHKFVYKNKEGKYEIDYPLLEYVVRFGIRFLDDVQELSETSIEEVNKYSKGLRRLGLGVMGWADLLAELMIPYDSVEAKNLSEYLDWFISFFSWLESIDLAKERGAFPMYDKDLVDLSVVEKVLHAHESYGKFNMEEIREIGTRNVAVNAIAPTGSISLLLGVNSSIEPFFGLAYKRNITEGVGNTAKDYVIELNPILFRKLEEHGYTEEQIAEIKEHIVKFGSARDCRLLDSRMKEVFKIANEIGVDGHLTTQESWQKYLSNSTSKTINMASTATRFDIEEAYFSAWKRGLKGITIYRDNSKSFQILNLGSSE